MSRKQVDEEAPPGVPWWVKAFGIAIVAIALVIGLLMATGHAGEHGPGRHLPGGRVASLGQL
jgi:hypothetical protein